MQNVSYFSVVRNDKIEIDKKTTILANFDIFNNHTMQFSIRYKKNMNPKI